MIEKEYVEVTTAQAYVLLADFHAAYKNDPDVHPVIDYLMDIVLGIMVHQHQSLDDAAVRANINIAGMNERAERAYQRVSPDAYQEQHESSSVDVDLSDMSAEEWAQAVTQLLAKLTGNKEESHD
jgi:hypothetical protein